MVEYGLTIALPWREQKLASQLSGDGANRLVISSLKDKKM